MTANAPSRAPAACVNTDRVLVVDSDDAWLSALARAAHALGADHVYCASDLESACRLVRAELTVVITEVQLASEACFPLLGIVRRTCGAARVITVSDRASRAQIFRLHMYGVESYLEKPVSQLDLLRVLAQPRRSRSSMDCTCADWDADCECLLRGLGRRWQLSAASLEVLRWGLIGLSTQSIASQRGVTLNTVKTQIRHVLARSGASSLRELRQRFATDARKARHARFQVERADG